MAKSLHGFPPELCAHITSYLPSCAEILAVAQTSQRNYASFNWLAYDRAARLPEERGARIALWAAQKGFSRVVAAAHDANINIDRVFYNATGWTQTKSYRELVVRKTDHDTTRRGRNRKNHRDESGWVPEGEKSPRWFRGLQVAGPIHLAAQAGHLETVRLLLELGASLTGGCCGICKCDRDPRRLDLFHRANFSEEPPRWTPLHAALCSGRKPVAELLLSRDPVPPMTSGPGGSSTALHAVAVNGDLALARRLIDGGHASRLNQRDWRDHTPLMYAWVYRRGEYWNSCPELFKYLLSVGADINCQVIAQDTDGRSRSLSIFEAVVSTGYYSAAVELSDIPGIDHGCALDIVSRALPPAKFWPVGDLLQRLVTSTSRPPSPDDLRKCLAAAVDNYNWLAVEELVRAGADINRGWRTPEEMLDYESLEMTAETPLYRVIVNYSVPSYETQREIDTCEYPSSDTQRHIERCEYRLKIVEFLLESGADPDLTFVVKDTALNVEIARFERPYLDSSIGNLLIEHGARLYRGTSGEYNEESSASSALRRP
jgi:hypothetical protein